VFSLILIFD